MATLILEDLETEKGEITKRKRNYLLREESIGSNFEATNSIIQAILPMDTVDEHELLKDVLFDYSTGVFTNLDGDYWSTEFWNYICQVYNCRANSRGLPLCTEANIIAGGVFLQLDYCMLRAAGRGDVKLDTIFKPCEDCNLRIVYFPVYFPKSQIVGLDYTSNKKIRARELNLVKDILLDYSKNLLQIQRGDYYSASFWDTLADEYNMRMNVSYAGESNMNVDTSRELAGVDILEAGEQLQHTFNTTRLSGSTNADLKQIFERCEICKRRIPVFPARLFSGSHSGVTIPATGSFRSGASIGNLNRTNTFLQSTSTDLSFYDVPKLVDALTALVTSNEIDTQLIGEIILYRLPEWNSEQYRGLVDALLKSGTRSALKVSMLITDYNSNRKP